MDAAGEKSARERRVFRDFARQSGLNIAIETIESKEPPEPDILCSTIDGEFIAFELVEFCDEIVAEALKRRGTKNGHFFRTADPSSKIIYKKLEKSGSYITRWPIELLCYTAGNILTPDDVIVPTVTSIVESKTHSFRRIWFLGEQGVEKLYEN